ncbi:sensor histidine kinase [Convivina intestini]|uniref:sensor histidine kinase n=1 Tax=Convivina intestini TaxID=1505726 RepID=UPI00200EDE0C|nr:GHKL domain-containing protein [Convivina intestini]CAH1852358.1 hypothetical protein R078131_00457 [Convivina intestini]
MFQFLITSVALFLTALHCGYSITNHSFALNLQDSVGYSSIFVIVLILIQQNSTLFWKLLPFILGLILLTIIVDSRYALLNVLLGFFVIFFSYFIYSLILNNTIIMLFNINITYFLFFIIINLLFYFIRHTIKNSQINIGQQRFWSLHLNTSLVSICLIFISLTIIKSSLKTIITSWPLSVLQSTTILLISIFTISIVYLFLKHERDIKKLKETFIKQQIDDLNMYLNTLKSSRHEYNAHLQAIQQLLKSQQFKALNNYMDTLVQENSYIVNVSGIKFPEISAILYRYEMIAQKKSVQLVINFDSNFSKIPLPLYDLNLILGNLLTNAFEASQVDRTMSPLVELTFKELKTSFHICIENTGSIPEKIQLNLLNPGITSKIHNSEHHGFGMYIISKTISKYSGSLSIQELPNHHVKIDISIPKNY